MIIYLPDSSLWHHMVAWSTGKTVQNFSALGCQLSGVPPLIDIVVSSRALSKKGSSAIGSPCLCVCSQTSVYDRGPTWFQSNVIFWTRIGKRTCSLVVLWLWICTNHACQGKSEIFFLVCLPVCLAVKQNSVISHRKFSVFKDVIKDTNNRHEKWQWRVT